MKTESNIRPTKRFELCKDTERNFLILNDLDSIVETEREGEKVYSWTCYQFKTSTSEEYVEEHIDELFELAKNSEFAKLAEEVREKRNKLLEESDKYMCLDRLNLDTSSAVRFLTSLKNIFSNDYTKYRQALRDITSQPNFPYDVTFPEKPKE